MSASSSRYREQILIELDGASRLASSEQRDYLHVIIEGVVRSLDGSQPDEAMAAAGPAPEARRRPGRPSGDSGS